VEEIALWAFGDLAPCFPALDQQCPCSAQSDPQAGEREALEKAFMLEVSLKEALAACDALRLQLDAVRQEVVEQVALNRQLMLEKVRQLGCHDHHAKDMGCFDHHRKDTGNLGGCAGPSRQSLSSAW